MNISFTLNGANRTVETAPLTPLLHVLREDCNTLSPKAACQAGGCGSCTVIVDGEARRSCLLPADAASGTDIRTIEGLAPPGGELTPLQQAWIHHYAAQCGFCASGFIMAATAYLEQGGSDDRDAITAALNGHHCRCTGYVKILDAVQAAARGDEFDLELTASGANTTIKGVER